MFLLHRILVCRVAYLAESVICVQYRPNCFATDSNKHHRFATQKQFYFKTPNNVKKNYEQNVTVQTVNGSAAAGGGDMENQ